LLSSLATLILMTIGQYLIYNSKGAQAWINTTAERLPSFWLFA
jgi:hypothetical protein